MASQQDDDDGGDGEDDGDDEEDSPHNHHNQYTIRRLEFRADFLHRYQQLRVAWRAWRRLHTQRSITTEHNLLALGHAKHVYCMKALAAWRTYTASRRAKNKHNLSAGVFAQLLLRKHTWRRWRQMLSKKRLVDAQGTIAALLHTRHVASRALCLWRSALYVRARTGLREAFAADFANATLCRAVLSAWQQYTTCTVQDRVLANKVLALSSHNRMQLAFEQWRHCLSRRHQYLYRTSLAHTHHQHHLLARVVGAWHAYTSIYRLKQARADAAYRMRARCLKRTMLHYMRDKARRHGLLLLHYSLARGFQARHLLCFAWGVWVGRMEGLDSPWLTGALTRMLTLRRRHLLSRSLALWRRHFNQHRIERTALQMATNFWQERVVCVVWSGWRRYVQDQRLAHSMNGRALAFRSLTLRRAAWRLWRAACVQVHRTTCVILPNVSSRIQYRLMRRAWRIWSDQLRARLVRGWQLLSMAQRRHRAILSTAMHSWRMYVAHQRRQHARAVIADAHCRGSVLQSVWARWVHGALAQRALRRRWRLACELHTALLLRRCLVALRISAQGSRDLVMRERAAAEARRVAALRGAWHTWRNAAVYRRIWARALMTQCLRRWRKRLVYVQLTTAQLLPFAQMVERARRKVALRHVFMYWRSCVNKIATTRRENRQLQSRVIAAWHGHSTKNRLLGSLLQQ